MQVTYRGLLRKFLAIFFPLKSYNSHSQKEKKIMIFSYRHVLPNSGTSSINLIGQILRLGENMEKSSFCTLYLTAKLHKDHKINPTCFESRQLIWQKKSFRRGSQTSETFRQYQPELEVGALELALPLTLCYLIFKTTPRLEYYCSIHRRPPPFCR